MPPETMKLILVFCTVVLTTRGIVVAELDAEEVQAPKATIPADEEDTSPVEDSTLTQEPLQPFFRRNIRSESNEIEARRRSSLDKNFMRFGRADKNILRFGRSNPQNILRFGRSGENFIRFGRNDGNFMRFGRNDDLMRLGRPDNNFIRFGRTSDYVHSPAEGSERRKKEKKDDFEWNDGKRQDNFMRFGRNKNTNFLRLGRSDEKKPPPENQVKPPTPNNILRFGRADSFMRFGRKDSSVEHQNFDSAEDFAEEPSMQNILPSEDDLMFIPSNYLMAKDQ
ncbi:hypothetical protein DMENIID0001_051140 [Sergentomyia squamirostris]